MRAVKRLGRPTVFEYIEIWLDEIDMSRLVDELCIKHVVRINRNHIIETHLKNDIINHNNVPIMKRYNA